MSAFVRRVSMGILLWSACGGLCVAQTLAYYQGRLVAGDLSWELGIHLSDVATDEARCDLISHWSLDIPLPVTRTGDRISCSLPAGLGNFSGIVTDDGIAGSSVLPDGRSAILQLWLAPSPLVNRSNFTVKSGEVRIAATLGTPLGDGPFPTVVFVHGAGDSSRDFAGTRFLSEFLPRFGIACAVYDKRGCGASTGNWRSVGFDSRARDVLEVIRGLKENPRVDDNKIGLFAGTEGSWVAGIAANLSSDVSFVVHHSGSVVPVRQTDEYSIRSRLRREGLGNIAIEEYLALRGLELAAMRRGVPASTDRAFSVAYGESLLRPWSEIAPYEPASAEEWWASWYPKIMDHDPRPLLRWIDAPMLWLYGGMDEQSDTVENVAILGRMMRDEGKDYTIHVFPRAGHGITVPASAAWDGSGLMSMAPGYFQRLIEWIKETTRDS